MWIAPTNSNPTESPRQRTPIYRDTLGIWADIPGFTAFAQEVADSLDGRDLRYSQRLKLLKRADHFGIRRFDANLIIAMVQHRMEQLPECDDGSNGSWKTTLAAIAVTQGLIIAGVWWLIAM